MTTVEAAQKWAEAKDKLEAASAAMQSAQTTYVAALEAEREAWLAMADLAGRVQPDKMTCFTTEAGHFDASGHAVPPSMPRARMNGGVIERE